MEILLFVMTLLFVVVALFSLFVLLHSLDEYKDTSDKDYLLISIGALISFSIFVSLGVLSHKRFEINRLYENKILEQHKDVEFSISCDFFNANVFRKREFTSCSAEFYKKDTSDNYKLYNINSEIIIYNNNDTLYNHIMEEI